MIYGVLNNVYIFQIFIYLIPIDNISQRINFLHSVACSVVMQLASQNNVLSVFTNGIHDAILRLDRVYNFLNFVHDRNPSSVIPHIDPSAYKIRKVFANGLHVVIFILFDASNHSKLMHDDNSLSFIPHL